MSNLTKEDIERIRRSYEGRTTLSQHKMPRACEDVLMLCDELLSLRHAGDEEVDGIVARAMENPAYRQNAVDFLANIATTARQQLREAREEIENLKLERAGAVACMDSRLQQIATLTAERDEALGKIHSAKIFIDALSKWLECGATIENSGDWHSYLQTVANNWNLRMQEACDLRDRLKSEIAALKSAPGMSEIDALANTVYQSVESVAGIDTSSLNKLAALARRSIAARAEVVGKLSDTERLIRWMVKHWDWTGKLEGLAAGCVIEPWKENARRILEIVEGK